MKPTHARVVSAEEVALAARAKAGDRAAVNDLLARTLPALRKIVFHSLCRSERSSFSVFEDAVAEAMIEAWNAIGKWEPARGSLATFVRFGVGNHAPRVAAKHGHAVALPLGNDGKPVSEANEHVVRALRCPLDFDNRPDRGYPLRDLLPAPFVDPGKQLDARRILSKLDPQDADVLLRVANGESLEEIGGDDLTREGVRRRHEAALQRARSVVCGKAAGASSNARREQRTARLRGLLAARPMQTCEIAAALEDVTHQAVSVWLKKLVASGEVVSFLDGSRTMYALPARAA